METDIELFHNDTGRKIVIDTKFTSLLKPTQFRDALRSGYLYQIYAYLRSQVDLPRSPGSPKACFCTQPRSTPSTKPRRSRAMFSGSPP